MSKQHAYALDLHWTGNRGNGTTSPRAYSRDHDVSIDGVGTIQGSSDPSFRGDPTRWNPEQLLVASVAQCHMLWYLGLAASAGVVVTAYEDHPSGTMIEEADGSGQFTEITLRPRVTISGESHTTIARTIHDRVGDFCFIARSINFPLHHEVEIIVI